MEQFSGFSVESPPVPVTASGQELEKHRAARTRKTVGGISCVESFSSCQKSCCAVNGTGNKEPANTGG